MDDKGNKFFPYHSEPVRGALLLGLILAIIGLILWIILPLLILQLFAASFAIGPLAWALLQTLRSRHGVTLEVDRISIQHPLTGWTRRIRYAHIQGMELLTDELAIAFTKPTVTDPTHKPMSLIDARPKAEQRKLILIRGIDQLDQLAGELRSRAVENAAVLVIPPEVVQTWANRIKVRRIIFVILGVMASPLACIFIFRTISDIIR